MFWWQRWREEARNQRLQDYLGKREAQWQKYLESVEYEARTGRPYRDTKGLPTMIPMDANFIVMGFFGADPTKEIKSQYAAWHKKHPHEFEEIQAAKRRGVQKG